MQEPTLYNYVMTFIIFAIWPGIPLAVIIWFSKHLTGGYFIDKYRR